MINGSTQSIGIRSVEVLIKIKFLKKGDRVYQYFIIDSGRNIQALRDSRFSIYNKFENKIKEFNLEGMYPQGFSFLERIDSEDKITLVYLILKEKIELENFYFIVAGFIAKNSGCDYCEHNFNKAENFIQCSLKKKTIVKSMKNCSVFKERVGLFVT